MASRNPHESAPFLVFQQEISQHQQTPGKHPGVQNHDLFSLHPDPGKGLAKNTITITPWHLSHRQSNQKIPLQNSPPHQQMFPW